MDKIHGILTDLYDYASQHGLMAARRYEELKTTAITNVAEQIKEQQRERVERLEKVRIAAKELLATDAPVIECKAAKDSHFVLWVNLSSALKELEATDA